MPPSASAWLMVLDEKWKVKNHVTMHKVVEHMDVVPPPKNVQRLAILIVLRTNQILILFSYQNYCDYEI